MRHERTQKVALISQTMDVMNVHIQFKNFKNVKKNVGKRLYMFDTLRLIQLLDSLSRNLSNYNASTGKKVILKGKNK